MAQNDLFTSDVSPPGSGAPRLLESKAMAQLAPVPDNAPVPPQNLEAEESVLGAMMLSPGAIGSVSEILDAGDFYRESHAKIYRAALQLYGKNEPVESNKTREGRSKNRRVVIINEADALVQHAQNALLKTLEEPPPHIIFVLATTEAHKVSGTIVSRCQRFDLRRIP